MPLRTSRVTHRDVGTAAAAVGSLAATAVVLAPAIRPGYVLFLDHVTVPDPVAPHRSQLDAPAGLRSWPLDGVVWAWSQVLPSWVLQQVILLLAVLGAGLGTGLLVRHWGGVAAFAASVLAIVNPYVIERLLLGQAVLLLGYASIPWIVIASRQTTPRRRVSGVSLASLPAALTPWGALVAGAVAVSVAIGRRRRLHEVLAQAAVSTALCLIWLVPALLAARAGADPNGARAFALVDETGLGLFGTALIGAGVWSSAAQVMGGGAWVWVVTAIVLALAVVGARVLARSSVAKAVALSTLLLLFPATLALLSGRMLGWWAQSQAVPGVALFRDLHRLLAPSIFVLVVLVALGLASVVTQVTESRAALAGVLGVVLPVSMAAMLVPTGPGRVHEAYTPTWFPMEWNAAMQSVGEQGGVLSLPWQPLRKTGWVPGVFHDPTPKALGSRVVSDTTLTVRRSGESIRVTDDPMGGTLEGDGGDAGRDVGGPRVDTLRRVLSEGSTERLDSDLLSSGGVSHILYWKTSPGYLPTPPVGWRRTFSGRNLEVWSDPGTTTR